MSDPAAHGESAGSRSPGRYPKGVARRQQVLDRAIEVFARQGSAGTSLRTIAEEIGVTHAALTHYFASREQLLVEVYYEAERRIYEAEALGPDATPVERMATFVHRYREVPGMVQLYSTLVATALEPGHPDATAFATQRFAGWRSYLADKIRLEQERGRLRSDLDPVAAASLVIAASEGLQTQWMLDEDVPQAASLELLQRLLAPSGEPTSAAGSPP